MDELYLMGHAEEETFPVTEEETGSISKIVPVLN
jgi:hypothetical protein